MAADTAIDPVRLALPRLETAGNLAWIRFQRGKGWWRCDLPAYDPGLRHHLGPRPLDPERRTVLPGAGNPRGSPVRPVGGGTLDDNVHPNLTRVLADELIKANKRFEMLALPKRNHRFATEPYFVQRTRDYFVRHLPGREPPEDFTLTITLAS